MLDAGGWRLIGVNAPLMGTDTTYYLPDELQDRIGEKVTGLGVLDLAADGRARDLGRMLKTIHDEFKALAHVLMAQRDEQEAVFTRVTECFEAIDDIIDNRFLAGRPPPIRALGATAPSWCRLVLPSGTSPRRPVPRRRRPGGDRP